MPKNNKVKNKSTKLFLDLAKRSFEESWISLLKDHDGDIREYISDHDFMSATIMSVIMHIKNNFESLTQKEGNNGNIDEVDLKVIANLLVRHSYLFVHKSL
ncbi:hypothetical protein ACDH98_003195 [Salmonella enterica]